MSDQVHLTRRNVQVGLSVVRRDVVLQVHHLTTAGGSSSAGFNFTQASPQLTWTINHNLGFRPAVELASVGGLLIFGQIQHTSVNQVLVTFNTAQAGTARLA